MKCDYKTRTQLDDLIREGKSVSQCRKVRSRNPARIALVVSFFPCRLDLKVQVAKLLGRNQRRRLGHQASAFGGFREGNHVPDAGCAAKDCQQAVETEGDATM